MTQLQNVNPKDTVGALLNSQKGSLLKALPQHLNADRFLRIVLTEVRKNPALEQCDQKSFMGAVIQAAQLGLELGSGLGYAYLIPYGKTCQMIVGYKGFIDLARRSGQLSSLSAHVVKEHDYFDYELGDNERIVHKPAFGDRGKAIAVYAIARLKDGGIQREVMSLEQLEDIRNRGRTKNPVWNTDWDEMARKTVIRRICKYLPLSPDMRDAIEHDEKEDGPTVDIEKFRHVQSLPDMATSRVADMEANDARITFAQVCEEVKAAGFSEAAIIGAGPYSPWSTEQLLNGIDRMRNALAKGHET